MIPNIEDEKRYHSIVVMRTKDEKLANTFPHTIFTKNNKLVYQPQPKQINYEYNVEIDAVKYQFFNHKIIIADFKLISCVYKEQLNKWQNTQRIIYYNFLKNSGSFQFYLYTQQQIFFKIDPFVIIEDSILFTLKNHNDILIKQQFKDTSYVIVDYQIQQSQNECFCFTSLFGLLSDNHFMNNFIRGYRQFSYYQKQGKKYSHKIRSKLLQKFSSILPHPKL